MSTVWLQALERAASGPILESLPEICSFPLLTQLDLFCRHGWDKMHEQELRIEPLAPLTALEKLFVNGWRHSRLEGGPLFPRLTKLQFCAGNATVNAALRSLQELVVDGASFSGCAAHSCSCRSCQCSACGMFNRSCASAGASFAASGLSASVSLNIMGG